jgi:riboflavin transporter FmnP
MIGMNWCDSNANGKVRMIEALGVTSPEASGGFFILMDYRAWIVLALLFVYLVALIRIYSAGKERPPFNWARFASRVAIFGALSTILYIVPIFQIQLPFLPSFLQLHFDEIPAFIAAFAYGPATGFAVLLIKSLIKLPLTTTMGVGELADLIFSSAFILPAAFIYEKKRDLKGVAIGFAAGTLLQLIVSAVLNVYAMLPFYMFVMGFRYEDLLAACQAVNPNITDLGWAYALLAVLPLNLIKDAIVIAVTFLVYRNIHRFLHFSRV